MQVARFVRTLGLLLLIAVAGSAGGCGPGSSGPVDRAREDQIKESKKSAHREIKATVQKGQGGPNQQGAARKSAHRKAAGG